MRKAVPDNVFARGMLRFVSSDMYTISGKVVVSLDYQMIPGDGADVAQVAKRLTLIDVQARDKACLRTFAWGVLCAFDDLITQVRARAAP